MKIKEKLIEFYRSNDLKVDGGVNEDWNKFKVGTFFFIFPNLNKDGYLMHDVNHLLCGYGIDWFGEFETAAWELGSGGRRGFGLSWFYPIVGCLLGLLLSPRRTWLAYQHGLKRTNAHILSKNHNILDLDTEQLIMLSYKDGLKKI